MNRPLSAQSRKRVLESFDTPCRAVRTGLRELPRLGAASRIVEHLKCFSNARGRPIADCKIWDSVQIPKTENPKVWMPNAKSRGSLCQYFKNALLIGTQVTCKNTVSGKGESFQGDNFCCYENLCRVSRAMKTRGSAGGKT